MAERWGTAGSIHLPHLAAKWGDRQHAAAAAEPAADDVAAVEMEEVV